MSKPLFTSSLTVYQHFKGKRYHFFSFSRRRDETQLSLAFQLRTYQKPSNISFKYVSILSKSLLARNILRFSETGVKNAAHAFKTWSNTNSFLCSFTFEGLMRFKRDIFVLFQIIYDTASLHAFLMFLKQWSDRTLSSRATLSSKVTYYRGIVCSIEWPDFI